MRRNAKSSTTRRVRVALSTAVAVCAATAVLPTAASARPVGHRTTGVERISVAPDGTQGDAHSAGASIMPDGHRIVFSSSATNLTPEGTTGDDRAYVRDQRTGQTRRIGPYSPLDPPVISGNGEYVAYPVQWVNNVRIRQYQVSTGYTASANCSSHSCDQPSSSADGSSLAFVVLFRQPSSGQRIEVHDGDGTKKTVADFAHTHESRPSLSGDGRYVAYQDGGAGDVFVWDRVGGTTTGPVEGPSTAAALVQLSDDGSKVVYVSGSDTYVHDVPSGTVHLVPNARGVAIDPTGHHLLYAPLGTSGAGLKLRDLRTGTDQIVSNQPATAGTDAVSAGGRDVVFQSTADDLVPGDTNGKSDVFVRRFP
ncbi:TolB family protein [Streptomyces sp. NPDC059816]|uniref:TolB family protein n=1 Tax=Streptomyces sp. NPDC059816 TaxID=3346960 RepID=UPI003655F206